MRIKITKTSTQEVELPKYFRDEHDFYHMTFGNQSVVRVRPANVDPAHCEALYLYPSITVGRVSVYTSGIKEVIPISEAEFKLAFITASVEIEKLSN